MSSGQKVKKEVKLVVAKGGNKGVKGRPKGVKGRYTMVDSRMKKEVRLVCSGYSRVSLTAFCDPPGSSEEAKRKGIS